MRQISGFKKKVMVAILTAMMTASAMSAPVVYAEEADTSLEEVVAAANTLDDAEAGFIEEKAEIGLEDGDVVDGELTEAGVERMVEKIEEVGDSYKKGDAVPEDDVIRAVDAVYTFTLALKDEGIVTKVNKRTSNVEVTFANGQMYTWNAGNEPSEDALEEEEARKRELQPVVNAPEPSKEEQTRWEPEDAQNKTQQFLTPVPSTTTRYEIFYSAGTEIPSVTFTSATGKYNLTAGQDVMSDTEAGFKFITRANMTIDGHDDMRFMTIYIDKTDDPGKWVMTVTAPSSTMEVIGVSSAVPEDWETTNSDVVTKPYGVIFWYVDAQRSKYRETPVALINELMNAKTSVSDVDKISDIEKPAPDYTKAYALVGILIFVLAVGVVAFFVISKGKKNVAQNRAKREAIVKKENAKVVKKKAKENDELDDILDDYSDEYIDDDDMSEYMDMEESDNSAVFTDDTFENTEDIKEEPVKNEPEIIEAPWLDTPQVKPQASEVSVQNLNKEVSEPVQNNDNAEDMLSKALSSAVSIEKPVVQEKPKVKVVAPTPVAPTPVAPAPTPIAQMPVKSESAPAWLATGTDDDSGDFF